MHTALTVHLLKNGLYSVGNEEKLNQKYLTSYFYIPNIIFTVLDVINSLYSWKCLRENFYLCIKHTWR